VRRLNQAAPEIDTVLIPDCGHDLTIVQTELFNRQILEFLQMTTDLPSAPSVPVSVSVSVPG